MSERDQTIEAAVEAIRSALDQHNLEAAVDILRQYRAADQAEIFHQVDEEDREALLRGLSTAEAADLLEEMEEVTAIETLEDLPVDQLAVLFDAMEPDEAADLLGDLPHKQASQILAEMEGAEEVLPLLGYPDETAGGRMTTSFIALRPHTTAEQAIDFLRQAHPDAEVPYYLFVVDRDKRLVGVIGLRELVTVPPDTPMESIMNQKVVRVEAGADQEAAADLINRYNLAALPVVDEANHLLGVVTRDDIADIMEDEATEDFLHLGAVETGPLSDRPYWSQRVTDMVRSRFFWLLTLFIAETLTGTVLRFYEGELKTVVSLSFFVPLLIGTGGNAGSQTVSTVIRALALREIRAGDILRVFWRELRVGILLGILVGIIAYLRALLWGVGPDLALTVAITILAICAWATTVASLIPVIAFKLGIDPTVISAPLMSTLIDATGLLIYFTLAAWLLPQL